MLVWRGQSACTCTFYKRLWLTLSRESPPLETRWSCSCAPSSLRTHSIWMRTTRGWFFKGWKTIPPVAMVTLHPQGFSTGKSSMSLPISTGPFSIRNFISCKKPSKHRIEIGSSGDPPLWACSHSPRLPRLCSTWYDAKRLPRSPVLIRVIQTTCNGSRTLRRGLQMRLPRWSTSCNSCKTCSAGSTYPRMWTRVGASSRFSNLPIETFWIFLLNVLQRSWKISF